jgi:hypothetical protein
MGSEGAGSVRAARAAVRPHDGLSRADAAHLGEEAAHLAALAEAGVPICPGWVVSFEMPASDAAALLADAWNEPPPRVSAGRSQPPPPAGSPRLQLRPWFRTAALATRGLAHWPTQEDLTDPGEVGPRLETLFRDVSRLGPVLGSSAGSVRLRVLRSEEGPFGAASSVGAEDGDPSTVSVWLPGLGPWTLDRKTMRTLEQGQGLLARRVLERAADLADRAQLALGRPVEIDWVSARGRIAVAAVRPLSPAYRFTEENWRIVSLLWDDEGPIAPLAVDALDKALREDSDPSDEARVRRVFARAYRRVEGGRGRTGEGTQSLREAATRAARVMGDVARPIAAASSFVSSLDDRLRSFDADELTRFDDAELLRVLRERQRVVIEAEQLLDRGRKATSAVIGALEASLGTLPAECVDGLAAIRRTRARRRLDERLAKAAHELGDLPTEVDPVPAPLHRRFAELRRELADRRPLGLDVRPTAYGASDAALVEGMRAALEGRAERAEHAQRDAIRRLLTTARARPLGSGRAALARGLTVMIERLADAKGTVAEGLAAANLRVRDAALEIGRRLVESGVVDDPEDVLYLAVAEIQEALGGEPGAYTARVRMRREEDARWRSIEPPTRLLARPAPRRPTYER